MSEYHKARDDGSALLGSLRCLEEMPIASWPEGAGRDAVARAVAALRGLIQEPIPMLLWCPGCGVRHLDEDEYATKPHHTHACQHCGMCWRPAVVATVGVRFLPGFLNRNEVEKRLDAAQALADENSRRLDALEARR